MVTRSGEAGGEGALAPSRGRSRGRPRFAVLLGAVWLVVPLVLFLLARDTLQAAHPAHLVTLAAAGLVGVVIVVVSHGHDDDEHRHRSRASVVVGRTLGILATVVVLGALVWLQPFPATPAAASAVTTPVGVRVTDAPTAIDIAPGGAPATRGLVFQPGARVDPRAYVPVLSAVARSGYLVVVVKQPLQIGLLARNAPDDALARHPEVTRWAVGGHSLGGVAASGFAADRPGRVVGLALWASYPLSSLAARTDLAVASVSGGNDGLTTPADVAESRAKLPASTTFTEVPGAAHWSFGDYGVQPGGGTETTSHEAAQEQIVTATVALLERM